MLPKQGKIMKLTSTKSFVFLSSLKHIHKSDARGPSPENLFLVNKVDSTTGTGKANRASRLAHGLSPASPSALAEGWFRALSSHVIELTPKTSKPTAEARTQKWTIIESIQV